MKSLKEMSAAELLNLMEKAPKALERMSAMREFTRRKVEQPAKVRAALRTAIDIIGLDEALAVVIEYCEERKERADEGEAMKWAIREDAIRNAAGESEEDMLENEETLR